MGIGHKCDSERAWRLLRRTRRREVRLLRCARALASRHAKVLPPIVRCCSLHILSSQFQVFTLNTLKRLECRTLDFEACEFEMLLTCKKLKTQTTKKPHHSRSTLVKI